MQSAPHCREVEHRDRLGYPMTDSPAAPIARKPKRRASLWRELLETAALTLAIFLAVRVCLQNFKVEGESMFPTLHNGEYILVDKISYMFHSPQRGDIVIFRAVPALQPDKDFIKRIVALPGESVAVHGGSVYINGRALREPYIKEPPDYTFQAQTVPKDSYFVLGDHRNDSYDSSKWVSTPWLARKYIIGKALVAYWPPGDISLFRAPTFSFR